MIRTLAIIAGISVIAAVAWVRHPRLDESPSPGVCFAPEGRCAARAIDALDSATKEIRGHAYNFTTISGFPDALVRAANRGVDVQIVVDKTTPCERGTGVPALLAAGIPVYVDFEPPIAHEKAWIIDGRLVVGGSYNWSGQAAMNSEAMTFDTNAANIAAYLDHWRQRLSVSRPFDADGFSKCKHPPA